MRLVIDLQGAQSASRYRGIGRYSLSLVFSIIRNAGIHEIWVVLNAAFPESIVEIRKCLHGLVLPERVCVFDVPAPVAEIDPANHLRARIAEKIREYFIQQLRPDVVLVTSLFEGYCDNAVTSITEKSLCERGRFKTAVILYDLIPFLNPSFYLSTILQKQYYNRKIESLKNADLLLAISDYSRQSAIEALEVVPEKIVSISGAVHHAGFMPRTLSPKEKKIFYERYGITRKIILYTPGGFDARKNLEGLFVAFTLLPAKLRTEYQLIITGKIDIIEEVELNKICSRLGLEPNALILTSYVSEEDLVSLYNLTTLFVFPSKQEGFGLPLLEAMACGVPVIGSNCSSIPEVIDFEEALFDPNSPRSIADKIVHVLTNESFYDRLKKHGLEQVKKFSWDKSAKRALHALEILAAAASKQSCSLKDEGHLLKTQKPRLAFVSPLPPEKTGIATYCAELLPVLVDYFEIELITDQPHSELSAELSHLKRRSVSWFRKNAGSYNRIIYQFGNSLFHTHMLGLLHQYPGVVVMHDFFLSGMLSYEEVFGNRPFVWINALYYSHGYSAVQARFSENGIEQTRNFYPCNLKVLQEARGIIVHSNYSRQLAKKWYGKDTGSNWIVISPLRTLTTTIDRNEARKVLGISEDTFLVCSFGFIDPVKLSAQLLDAWLASELRTAPNCKLVFVGENHGGDYGSQLIMRIHDNNCQDYIKVTGWVDRATYELYLQAANVSVQLRTQSRGETSAAVLDCMNYGLAIIVNANGSMAELPQDAVWMLPDEFTQGELTNSLETLWQNKQQREKLACCAREVIVKQHDPKLCAKRYAQAIESIYQNTEQNKHALFKEIISIDDLSTDVVFLEYLSQILATTYIPAPLSKQLLIDVSSIMRHDLKTGIERVVHAQLLELIKNPPRGFRVEPVYFTKQNGVFRCCYARKFTLNLLNLPSLSWLDNPIDVSPGDIYYAADFAPYDLIQASKAGLFTRWRALGVQISLLVYDLLPILKPEFFPTGAAAAHTAWLEEITSFSDQLIGISSSVANDLRQWLEQHKAKTARSFTPTLKIFSVPLGADIAASAPTTGLPTATAQRLKQLQQTTSFLMVGTIEPRKGYLQALAAFEQLWAQGHQIQLVIVGKEGWKQLSQDERRTIPTIVNKLSNHPELNKRLFWLQEVSDEYLQKIYTACTCLLAASEGEGFGLPLIEAAYHKLPIIARDLPVFREIAQQNAYYFNGFRGEELATAINNWLTLYANGKVPSSTEIKWNTWKQNVEKLTAVLTTCYKSEYACADHKTTCIEV